MKLRDFASDTYSQFGEDGIIEHIFEEVLFPPPDEENTQPQRNNFFCVEFGASDDMACSNVANLWKNKGWKSLVIEADPVRAATLAEKVNDNCEVMNRKVEPTGEASIDRILAGRGVDFMSIDIDGNDYHIWRKMETTPILLCVEFNPTIPPHVSVHQEYDETLMGFGASLKSLIDLSLTKGYAFIGATEINAFFVLDRFARHFGEYEREMPPYSSYTYLVTDFLGHAVAVGAKPPWGIHLPFEGPTLAGSVFSITEFPQQTMDAYELKYGRKMFRWPQENMPNIANPDFTGPIPGGKLLPISARNLLRQQLEGKRPVVCIGIAHVSLEQVEWVYGTAAENGYRCRTGGGVLTLLIGAE